jgi:hypothetical protein
MNHCALLKMSVLDSSALLKATFTAPATRRMKIHRHRTKTTEPATVEMPPRQCDHFFGNEATPCSHCKSVSGFIVAVAPNIAYHTPDYAAVLQPPPARFDANAQLERSLTSIASPSSESLAAIARKSTKRVLLFIAAPEFFKNAATWFAALKLRRGAPSSNLNIQAASTALIIFVSCFVFPNITVAMSSYEFAIGMRSWSCPIASACKSNDSCWQAPWSLQAASALPWREMRLNVIRRGHEIYPMTD